jgi:predicted enzyme related to lactoylglutathione lyase
MVTEMKLKYIPVYAGNFEEQLKFYTDKLGFRICENVAFQEGGECTLVETGNYDVLLAISKNNLHAESQSCIILNTDDCLNDHHQLKNAGVDFCTEPHYLPVGLVAEFKDPGGNKFLLLEERDYNEL